MVRKQRRVRRQEFCLGKRKYGNLKYMNEMKQDLAYEFEWLISDRRVYDYGRNQNINPHFVLHLLHSMNISHELIMGC